MKSNHELEECKQCAWNKGRSFTACEVFLDKRNVILDEYGRCNALANEEKKKQVELECLLYEHKVEFECLMHEHKVELSKIKISKVGDDM